MTVFKKNEQFRKTFLARFKRVKMDTTPGDALLLRILIESMQARRGVEIGTFNGHGAMNMGMGFEKTRGRLTCLEIDAARARKARSNLRKVGLEKTVTVVVGDATQLLATLRGKFDFVFIDAVKRDYFRYLKAIEPKLKRGAVVVADNVITHAADMPDFLDYIQTSPDYESVILRASLEKGDGMSLSRKMR